MANVRIDIASEFDNKGFRKAESATTALQKQVAVLEKKLASAFSAYKIAQFAKQSVQAFAEDQKSAALLAKTLQNVNQGFADSQVESYIAKTEALYGVLDEKLRPAFSQLVVATHDAGKAQALLQTALDVSAGTGKDLESVTAALAKGYLGNTTALQRLGVGLSKADLKAKSFNDVITILNQNFAGATATAADTFQGKLDRLNVAFDNMKETIGRGIVDGFGALNTDQGFNGVIDKMGALSEYIANITVGIGTIAGKIKGIVPNIGGTGNRLLQTLIFPAKGALDALAAVGAKSTVSKATPQGITNFLADMSRISSVVSAINDKNKKNLQTQVNLTKEQQKQLALSKAQLALKQADSIFNMDKIEVEAALLQKQSAEDYARLQLKKDLMTLQDAINAGDVAAATAAAEAVNADYKRVQAYQAMNIAADYQKGLITNITEITKQFGDAKKLIDLDNLNAALKAIQNIADALNKLPTVGSTSAPRGVTEPNPLSPAVLATAQPSDMTSSQWQKVVNDYYAAAAEPLPTVADFGGIPFDSNAMGAYGYRNPNLTVTIVDNTSGLIDVVTDATQQASANGVSTRILRNTGSLNW